MKLLKRIFGAKSGRPRDAAAKLTPAIAARVLFEGCVQKDQAPPVPEAELSPSLWPQFESKWRLYREAIVLMLLLSREQKGSKYSELVKEYERLIYPTDYWNWVSEQPTPEGLAKASALKAAMQDIAELIEAADPDHFKPFTWSRKWFEQLGERPSNPVTSAMFAVHCITFREAVAKLLKEMDPELS